MRARTKMVTAEMEISLKSKESLYEASAVSSFKGNPADNWRLNCVAALAMVILVHTSLCISTDRTVYK